MCVLSLTNRPEVIEIPSEKLAFRSFDVAPARTSLFVLTVSPSLSDNLGNDPDCFDFNNNFVVPRAPADTIRPRAVIRFFAPLNQPVDLPVTIAPTDFGVHTAHLTLDHPQVTGFAYRSLATIIAPRPLTASNDFSDETRVTVPRPGITSEFYRVPEGTRVLMVDLGWEDREVSLAISAPDTRQARGQQITRGRGVTQVIHNPVL